MPSRLQAWASLARRARRVYVGTSQAGLEALIQGVPVTCFGLPFYAGWGLTDDRMAIARRQARPDLVQLVAAAYVRYCRYVDPLSGQLTDALTVARQLALSQRYDAVICLGAVIRGQTPHFDYVCAEVSKGIAAASFQTGVPVVFGIVTTDTMQQALERAGIKSNLGWNYAMSALEMASLMAQVRTVAPAVDAPPIALGSLPPTLSEA